MANVAAAFARRGFAVPDGGDLGARLVAAAAAAGGPDKAALAFEAYAMETNIPRGELTTAAVAGFEATTKAASAAVAAKRAAFGGLSWDDTATALADGTNTSLRRSVGAAHTTPAAVKRGGVLGGGRGTPVAAAAAAAPAARTPAAAAAATTPGAPLPSPGAAAFAARAGSGEAIATLAPPGWAPLPAPPPARPPRVGVGLVGAAAAEEGAAAGGGPSRLLTDSLADRAAFLEARIAAFAAAFEAATGAPPAAPVGVALQAEASVFAGRVVCEGAGAAGGRLNAASVVLEGSAALSSGGRVRLDVSKLVGAGGPGYRLFPGQAVAAVGACPAGHTLVAAALHTSLPLPPSASGGAALARAAAATGPAGMRVLVAAGPFTPPDGDGTDFAPLDAVLRAAAGAGGGGRPADALVLIGPFIDSAHPAWTSPAAPDASFDDIFAREVVGRLAAFVDARAAAGLQGGAGGATHLPPILLVPSVRDATALPTFPTPPLALPAGTPACVHALPNPATFTLNEVVVGATSSDPLFAIAGCEAGAGPGGGVRGDRMGGLAAALLEQRCFYPAYPPAPGACLDARRARGHAGAAGGGRAGGGRQPLSPPRRPSPGIAFPGGASPDLLLLPSDLSPFARVAAAAAGPGAPGAAPVRAVAVNPGRCVRPGGGGGSLAWLDVAPLLPPPPAAAAAAAEDDEGLAMEVEDGAGRGTARAHALEGRARVEVVRL